MLTSNGWKLYYDGDCGICQAIKRWMIRLDFFNKIDWIPYQSLDEPLSGLTWEDFDRAVYLDTGNDAYYEGFYAFRMMTLKMLPLMPLSPIMWFPGVSLVGTKFYTWFASNRYRFSRCKLPAAKKDSQNRPS